MPPRDAELEGTTRARRAAGVSCLLVASGGFPVDELEGLGADALLADLGDTERVLDILVG